MFPSPAHAAPLLTTLREARPFTSEELAYTLPILLLVISLLILLDYWFIRQGDKKK